LEPFKGKTILITGASDGIGRALALELARDRPQLTLAARDADRLASLAAECEALGAQVLTVPTDVADPEACRRLVERSQNHFGRLDVLVNNAGITMWARFDAVTDLAAFRRVMDVNYFGSLYTTAAALPHLKQTRGLIVAVASVAGLTGVPQRTGYSASKHAMIGFFDSLRIELRGTGVDVSVIAPDFVVSQIHRRAIGPNGKPLGQSPMNEERVMTAARCAQLIRGAMEKRQRLLITSWRGRFARLLKILAPVMVDGIAARAIERRY